MDNEKDLEDLFAEARNARGPVPDRLFRQILVDAADVQRDVGEAQTHVDRRDYATVKTGSIWRVIGGWPAAVSFAACAGFGLYLGLEANTLLTGMTELVSSNDSLLGDLNLLYGEI
ncbi:MAG: hypothetical protein AAGJ34_08260 [Pseudomonadota bacterium]